MAYELWRSPHTGLKRKGTTFKELQAVFTDHITTKFICEPLYFCRLGENALEVRHELQRRDFDFVAVSDDTNRIIGYCQRDALQKGDTFIIELPSIRRHPRG